MPVQRLARWTALVAATSLLLLASAAFFGWVWLLDGGGVTGTLPVPPSTAACFLALGLGLLGLLVAPAARWRWDCLALGLLTSIFAGLVLLESTHRLPLRMSEIFLGRRDDPLLAFAVRMSPGTALDFVLSGLALALFASPWRGPVRALMLQCLVALPLASSFVALLDNSLRALHLIQAPDYQSLPALAALGFMLFGIAQFAALEVLSPRATLLFHPGLEGRLVRRVLPAALLVLGASTALGLVAVDRGRITPPVTLCLLLLVNGLSLSGLLALSATHLVRPLLALQHYMESRAAGVAADAASESSEDSALPPDVARALRDARCEFGDFAQLLQAFLRQQHALLLEVQERRRAEAALRDSEAKHRRLLEASPLPTLLVEDGRLSFANATATQLFRASSSADLLGTHFEDLVYSGDRARVQHRMQQVVQCGNEARFEVYLARHGGEEFLAEIEAQRLGALQPGAVQLTIADVGGRERDRQLQEANTRRLEMLLRKMTALLEARSLEERLRHVAEAIRALGWLYVRIHVLGPDLETCALVASGCTPEEERQLRLDPDSSGSWRRWLETGADVRSVGDYRLLVDPVGRGGSRGEAAAPGEAAGRPGDRILAPLRGADGELVGVIVLEDPILPTPPSPESLEPLTLFAGVATSCILQQREEHEWHTGERTTEGAAPV